MFSAVTIWTLDPRVDRVNGDRECCGFDGAGCWNCSGARLTQFFMLVLSVLLLWLQFESMPTQQDPVQSVLIG